MALSIIGAGFGRTGTMSFKLAIEKLGYGPGHHMEEVFANSEQLPGWEAAASGEEVDWDEIFAGYNSTTDWPGAHFWQELSDHFPDAKVILTMRDAESWWASYSQTIMKFFKEVAPKIPVEHARATGAMAFKIIRDRTFGDGFDDKDKAISVYNAHVAKVRATISPDRLLCFAVKDGWAPLCDFLGHPVPDVPFPRTNNREEFWDIIDKAE